jgi:hypothetical protein
MIGSEGTARNDNNRQGRPDLIRLDWFNDLIAIDFGRRGQVGEEISIAAMSRWEPPLGT